MTTAASVTESDNRCSPRRIGWRKRLDALAWETGTIVFVADDLGAWLTGLLADASRRKLITLVLGTEQERALRSAATAAVQRTAEEMCPGDDEQGQRMALVISQVFREHVPAASLVTSTSVLEALQAGVAGQLAVLGDASLTGTGQSSADVLGVSATVLTEKLTGHLLREIVARGARGGPLFPLAAQLNHDVTHLQGEQIQDAVRQLDSAIREALARLEAARPVGQRRAQAMTDAGLQVEQLLDDLDLGDHEEAERRVNRLFLQLARDQQQAAIEAIIHVAITTKDHTAQLLACSLLEAAGRLDPMLITSKDVENMARSADSSLRSSAAVLMWQWAESIPGRVPIPLLARLTQPSTEDWYVHAAARAGAKQLLLRRAAGRVIFDRMAASRDQDDRDYAVADLLEVAEVEPRAVPVDLARKLTADRDESVAARAAKLLRAVHGVREDERRKYYGPFGM